MPIYTYQVIRADGGEGELFEIQQSMKDEALSRHPVTGESIRRVYSPPNVVRRYSDRAMQARTTQEKIAEAGFTRYERDKLTGTFHKTNRNRGPETLLAD
ncbi:MAG: FmdB family transcriptional regulator [Opitutales bacterium]